MRPPLLLSAIVIAIFAASTASIFIRFAQADGAPSLVIAALRLTLASVLLAPYALTRDRTALRAIARVDLGLLALSGIFLAAHFATWITSLEYTNVASSAVLVSTGPLWVALVAPLVLNEKLTRSAALGLALALAGAISIALDGACAARDCAAQFALQAGSALRGDLLAVLGALAISGYFIIGRKLSGRLPLSVYAFLVYSCGALVLNLYLLLRGIPLLAYAAPAYLWIALLAVIPQLIGHTTLNWALKFFPASVVALITLGEPIGSAILAFVVLNESPSPATIAGGGLILAGIYLAVRTNR